MHCPITLTLLGPSAAERAQAVELEIAATALAASARTIATDTAALLQSSFDEAWQHVATMPLNAVDLFASPQGWSLVSQHVALMTTGLPSYIMPTVH